jgi:hypothetical protein
VRVCFEQFLYLLFSWGNIGACWSIDLTVAFGSKIRKFSSVFFFRFFKCIELGVDRNLVGKKIFKFYSNEPEIFKFNWNLPGKVFRTFNKLKREIKESTSVISSIKSSLIVNFLVVWIGIYLKNPRQFNSKIASKLFVGFRFKTIQIPDRFVTVSHLIAF